MRDNLGVLLDDDDFLRCIAPRSAVLNAKRGAPVGSSELDALQVGEIRVTITHLFRMFRAAVSQVQNESTDGC